MKKLYVLLIALLMVNGVMAQWVPQNSGTMKRLRSVYFTDVNTGYAVGDGYGVILKTNNGGIDWIKQMDADSLWFFNSVFFTDVNTGYVVGAKADTGAIILKTINGGSAWSLIYVYNGPTRLTSVFFPDAITGYAVGCYDFSSGGSVPFMLKTTDGGTNWIATFPVEGEFLSSLYFTSVDTGYAVGVGTDGSWIILKTANGGTDWTTDSGMTLTYSELSSVFFPDANTGYAVGNSDGQSLVLKTTNGGIDWAEQPSSAIQLSLNTVFFMNADTGYVGNNEGIYRTTNGGTDWVEQISLPAYNWINSIYFVDADTGYAVGWNGTILKTINGGGYPVGINDHNQPITTLTIYPNPAIDNITLETVAKGSLSIHNTSGQLLLQRAIIEPATTIDISGWRTGVYVVKVIGESGVQLGKMVKW